jgi:hypothetical protein
MRTRSKGAIHHTHSVVNQLAARVSVGCVEDAKVRPAIDLQKHYAARGVHHEIKPEHFECVRKCKEACTGPLKRGREDATGKVTDLRQYALCQRHLAALP